MLLGLFLFFLLFFVICKPKKCEKCNRSEITNLSTEKFLAARCNNCGHKQSASWFY